MPGIVERLEDFVFEMERAQEKMKGDTFTQEQISSMVPLLVTQMKEMDLSEAPVFKGHKLLFLGKSFWQAAIGDVKCDRVIYLGDDGKFYIAGPRKSFGKVVIDIHPYGLDDARSWDRIFGGVSLTEISDLLTTYFI